MKAKIKATGEIIEVSPIGDGYGGLVGYFNKNDGKNANHTVYTASDLDFFPEPFMLKNKEIDWEQRRYEIAKDVLCACIQYDGYDVNEIDCIYIADSLIEELKKK